MLLTSVDPHIVRKLGHYSGYYSHRVILFFFLIYFLFSRNSLQHSDTGKIGLSLILRIPLISFDSKYTQWQNRVTLVYLGLCNPVLEFIKDRIWQE